MSSDDITTELLEEYVRCNCCRRGRAQHRDRIEDIDLLRPLAKRWRQEILDRAVDQSEVTAEITKEAIEDIGSAARAPPQGVAPDDSEIAGLTGSQESYNLRPRGPASTTNSVSTGPISPLKATRSEFRPHVAEPTPSDSVSYKLRERLDDRDFETGSLYIFDRSSSPGHVKIGWTARSVLGRLERWAQCGYTPNLGFQVNGVPHAQRVETLTHHELMKEWRRERMCKAEWCRKSHQEWFEIGSERAARVITTWVAFMKIAEPYEPNGSLKGYWVSVTKSMDGTGMATTGESLLAHYRASLASRAVLTERLAELETVSKSGHPVALDHGHDEDLKTEPLVKVEFLPEGDLVEELSSELKSTVSIKELQPEWMPLPPSPLLQPQIPPDDTTFVATSMSHRRPAMEDESWDEDDTLVGDLSLQPLRSEALKTSKDRSSGSVISRANVKTVDGLDLSEGKVGVFLDP